MWSFLCRESTHLNQMADFFVVRKYKLHRAHLTKILLRTQVIQSLHLREQNFHFDGISDRSFIIARDHLGNRAIT